MREYIGDMWPVYRAHFREAVAYTKMTKVVEKVLAEMRTTRYCDWVIHKKLREAKTVYVAFARGENKYRAALNRVRDLVSAGYDVRPMNQLQLYSALMAGSRSKYTLRDMDILTPEECYRADAFLSKCLGEWVHKEAERRIRPDGLIVGNNTTMGGDE